MQIYENLALELFDVLDMKHKGPPQAEVGAAMRGEMAVLRLLSKEKESLPAGEVSRRLCMTTSRIAAVLGSLEKKGMLTRIADEQDKRRVLVTLTDSGRSFCAEKRARAVADMAGVFAQLGQEDAAHFVRIVRRMHELMPEPPPGGEDGQDIKLKEKIKTETGKEDADE